MTPQDLLDAIDNLRDRLEPNQPVKVKDLIMILEETQRIERIEAKNNLWDIPG